MLKIGGIQRDRPKFLSAALNRNHPLSVGLKGCFLHNEPVDIAPVNMANPSEVWYRTTAPQQMTSLGMAAYFDPENSTIRSDSTTITIPPPFSMLCINLATATRDWEFAAGDRTVTQGFTLRHSTDIAICNDFGYQASAAWVTHGGSQSYTSGTWQVYCCVADGSSSASYFNGKDVSVTTAAATENLVVTRIGGDGDGRYPLHGYLAATYLWGRRLSGPEVMQISSAPYQIFSPVRRKHYFFSAGAVPVEPEPWVRKLRKHFPDRWPAHVFQ